MNYSYKRHFTASFDEVLGRVRAALAEEGFGILSEINVQETLKEKLGVDFGKYIILGACNPPFAYDALQIEKEIGLLLPCNVIVYEDGEGVFVSSILPTVAMSAAKDELSTVAKQVEIKLKEAIDAI